MVFHLVVAAENNSAALCASDHMMQTNFDHPPEVGGYKIKAG